MTHDEAIESLINTCNNLKEAIEQLQEENAFLADTIEKNHLNKIVSERRSLLSDIKQRELKADSLTRAAITIKSEYSDKLNELNERLSDVKSKQLDIDSYIDIEADKKAESIKADYQKHKKANDIELQKHIEENDNLTKEKELSPSSTACCKWGKPNFNKR